MNIEANIKQKIQNIYDNQSNIEYQSYPEIFDARMILQEISRFVLPREVDWHENYFYHGVTNTMREIQQDPVVETDGVETVVLAERDFFNRIIVEEENKSEESQNEQNKTGKFRGTERDSAAQRRSRRGRRRFSHLCKTG